MIKFSSLNRRMKYVSTPEIPLPACWKFAEVVFSVDSVQGGQGPRKEGQVLGGGGRPSRRQGVQAKTGV